MSQHKLSYIGALSLLFLLTGFLSGVSYGAAEAGHVIVAKSGGDYTLISTALAAINPSATNPYVIDVYPGTYTENITMKSYVHLRGAGRDVTKIVTSSMSSPTISLSSLTNSKISETVQSFV